MHELSIAMSIAEVAEEESARRGVRVIAVRVKAGALSGVVAGALVPAYEMAVAGTPLENSRLVVEEAPVVVFCPGCNEERTCESPVYLCCPVCGAPTPEIRQGRELEVTALEVEEQ